MLLRLVVAVFVLPVADHQTSSLVIVRDHEIEAVLQSVATGEVELYISLTNIIASAKGIELAGAFPPELQHYLVISAGMSANTKEPKEAKALIKLLTSKSAVPAIKAAGLEPVAQ